MSVPRETLEATRAGVEELEALMMADDEAVTDYPTDHMFAHGLYGRRVVMPAGTSAVGKIHKHSCITIVLRGLIATTTDSEPMVIRAPYAFVSPAGSKRAVFAIEETEWMTVQASDKTNLEELENELTVQSFEQLESDS